MKKSSPEELSEKIPDDTEKVAKQKKRQERLEKRKKSQQKDVVARWSGLILLGLILLLSFVLWVAGEMESGNTGVTPPPASPPSETVRFQ